MQKQAKAVFEQYLSKKNLKATHQRNLILETFLKTEKHLTHEELYEIVKKKDKSIGQTTVYRTLKLLVESDIAREVDFGDRIVRYEHKCCHIHHDHLICMHCKKTIEIVDSQIEELQESIAAKYGFVLVDHNMSLYGICNDCFK